MNAETILQNAIRIALSAYGIVLRMQVGLFLTLDGRTVNSGIPGTPDLLFVGMDGRTVWVEVKTKRGVLSKDQKRFIARLELMGHRVGVVRSVEDALALIGENKP